MGTLCIFEDYVYLFRDGGGTPSSAEEFLKPIEQWGTLKALKEVFPAPRAALLEALAQFGFDFDKLLNRNFEQGWSDVKIARKHGVDPKWIRDQRKRLNFPAYMGRPSRHQTDTEIVEAYERTQRHASEAARRLGMDRATFTKRHQKIRDRERG